MHWVRYSPSICFPQADEETAAVDAAPGARRNAFKLLQQAGAGKQRPGSFFKDSFVDMEVRICPPDLLPSAAAGSTAFACNSRSVVNDLCLES